MPQAETQEQDQEETTLTAYRFQDDLGRWVMNAPPGEEQEAKGERLTLFSLTEAKEFAEFNGLALVAETYLLVDSKMSTTFLDEDKPAHTVHKDDWLFFEGEGGQVEEA